MMFMFLLYCWNRGMPPDPLTKRCCNTALLKETTCSSIQGTVLSIKFYVGDCPCAPPVREQYTCKKLLTPLLHKELHEFEPEIHLKIPLGLGALLGLIESTEAFTCMQVAV